MSQQERLWQIMVDICENRRWIAQVRLEALLGAENPYSLMQVFGRGHQVTRNGATVQMTGCQPMEVVLLEFPLIRERCSWTRFA